VKQIHGNKEENPIHPDYSIEQRCGWGIAAFTFGIGRIWASYKFEFYWFMVILGLLEGVILSLYCLINVFFLEISLLQVMFSLSVGSVYGVFYFIALLFLLRLDKSN